MTEQFTVDDMAAFDLIVCIDNAPAARQLCRAGLGSRLVFVDDLLQWRAGAGDLVTEGPLQAYLVQDFPGAAQHLARCRAHRVELVAPVVWRSPAASVPERDRAGVTVCFGGGTSPPA